MFQIIFYYTILLYLVDNVFSLLFSRSFPLFFFQELRIGAQEILDIYHCPS
jgi:hypothetical protein